MLQIFVVSWRGQHDNALKIATELSAESDQVFVVYSDPDPEFAFPPTVGAIRRSDDGYWGDKFSACLEHFSADLMLVIHADCHCSDWTELARKCRAAFGFHRLLGAWSPNIDGTPYELKYIAIAPIHGAPLTIVAHFDALVFALSKQVVNRMKAARYQGNVHGWGIAKLFVTFCFSHNLLVTVDRSLTVRHTLGRGYESETARAQFVEFKKTQFTAQELIQDRLLETHLQSRGISPFKVRLPGRAGVVADPRAARPVAGHASDHAFRAPRRFERRPAPPTAS